MPRTVEIKSGEHCHNCEFYRQASERLHKFCMRYPTSVYREADGWCGEWKSWLDGITTVPRDVDEYDKVTKTRITRPENHDTSSR